MDPPALDGYLREVCQQCWLALLASMQLRDLLQLGAERLTRLRRPDASRVWHLECWQAVQTTLSSGAALSRLLWPGGGTRGSLALAAARRRGLRGGGHAGLRDPGVRAARPA